MNSLSARDQVVRELDRTKKRDLIIIALLLGRARGDHWIIGGPDEWSKDELVAYIARESDR